MSARFSASGCRSSRQCLGRLCGNYSPAVVLSRQIVPADAKHFLAHACPVQQGIDAGSSTVSPAHGNFPDFEPELAREEKNLRVKAPALDALQGQNGLRGPPGECFEAALSIFELKA